MSKMAFKENFEKYKAILLTQLERLSNRERGILVVSVIILVLFAASKIYTSVSMVYSLQSANLEQAQRDLDMAGKLLQRYSKLKARRTEIEAKYKQIEIKEGGLSLLEDLVRNKAGVASGFVIKDGPIRQFGGNYEQAPFSVKFPIVSLERLLEFLEAVVHGPQHLVLTKLDLKKGRASDRLDVELDVSTFRRLKS